MKTNLKPKKISPISGILINSTNIYLVALLMLLIIKVNSTFAQGNQLMPNDLIVSYGVVVHPDSLILDTKPIDIYPNYFRDIITEKLVNNELSIFQPYPINVESYYVPGFNSDSMSHQDLMNRMMNQLINCNDETKTDTVKKNWDDLSHVSFYEKWNIDTTNLSFDKQVLSIIPALSVNRCGQRLEALCLIPFNFDEKELIKLREKAVLSKRIKYMVQLFDEDNKITKLNAPFYNSIVHNRLIDFIFKNVRNARLTPYDFYTNDKLTAMEYENRLCDSLVWPNRTIIQRCQNDEIKELIFIEDWYITKEPFMVFKKVIGIAPVRDFDKIIGFNYNNAMLVDRRKIIPFVVYFDEKKRF
jgi:hypothetical protein